MKFKKTANVILCILMVATTHAADDLTRPIRVSSDGHFLVQPDGQPFFWLGDTAWELFHRLNREEAEQYLQDRAAKGFTIIQAVAIGLLDGVTTPNAYGDLPLIDTNPERPNPRYWEHVDWIVDRAGRHGLRVAMLPVWGAYQVKGYGKSREVVFNFVNGGEYGRWIGARYRGKGVVWVLGGDVGPVAPDGTLTGDLGSTIVDYRPVYDAMARGIVEGDGEDPFITYHPDGLSFSGTPQPRTSHYFHDRAWLDMNMLQSSHFSDRDNIIGKHGINFVWDGTRNYESVADEYASSPTRPVVDGEPRYEDHPVSYDITQGYWRAYDCRNAIYHALFAGAAGHTYGNFNIWDFYSPSRKVPDGILGFAEYVRQPWQEALDAPGAGQMRHAKALMLSRPYFSRIPDQSLVVGETGERDAHIGATRSKDGSYAMIYLPKGQPVKVDLSKLAGMKAVAWWFDPRTGEASRIAESFATTGVAKFTAPSSGPDTDWVLVLDDESRNFPKLGN